MQYMTMICDIKNSEQLENREAVQYLLINYSNIYLFAQFKTTKNTDC
ncbi:hypothetical protein DealDRAFT_0378 [Dethiobacter alkaliphilus AHT 1]|uniref:Uncharacterized protein n=1 Tax=Dethiobacter alkaliphilus AHT 1 TaxID=555088 RepID=C0GD19_DETAL|nr:hypothetical protein DealDRAFT_0378 [Dethiobacter alkaliphilus AHT 1]